jgi:CheY-like chemotaxis protein
MHKKRVSFNIFIDPTLPKEIRIDTLKLKRIIINLIGNAYKFTPTQECIEFSVRYKIKDRKIHIFVKDTGIGIAKAKAKQIEIFEEFKQAEDDTSSKYGGYGLGLAICARYVKELGGYLNLESELDEGSIFYFDMPIEFETQDITFKPIENKDAKISILMDKKNSCSANNIARYIVKMGIDNKQVEALKSLEEIDKESTHIIAFQNQHSRLLETFCKNHTIELLIVEEEFLSLSVESSHKNLVISQYSYFANTLYSFLDVNELPRVLIADDDRISISLLKSILNEEHCIIETAYNGEIALKILEDSIKSKREFSVIFLDNYMPILSGDEVVNTLRLLEKKSGSRVAYVASISGELLQMKDRNSNYDSYIGKPFNKSEIQNVFHISTSKQKI